MAGDMSAGVLHADVVPDFSRFGQRLKQQSEREGNRAGRVIGQRIAATVAKPVTAGIARAVREGLTEAGKRMPAAGVRHARAYMRAFRETVARARPVTIPVRVDADVIAAVMRGVREQAKQSGEESGKEFGDGFDTKVKESTRRTKPGPAKTTSRKAGEESGGGFADGFTKRMKAALKALPPVTIGVARNEAEQQVKDLTSRIQALSDKRVGVDIDAAAALAEVEQIQRELDRLARTSPDVQVRSDTAAAQAQLAAVLALAGKVAASEPTVKVDADTGAATAKIAAVGTVSLASSVGVGALGAAIALLGPIAVPAAAAAAGALAAIGPAALVGVAGIGVLTLALTGVGDAVKALGEAEASAGKDAAQSAARQAGLASALDSVRNAQQGVRDARDQAAEGARRAAAQVVDAERALSSAQRDALDVQRDLTRAREEARRALEDLSSQVRDNALEQRQAVLDVAEARAELDKVLGNPRATLDQQEQARIRYEREVNQQEDLKRRGQRLQAEQRAATKAGIEGSEQVRSVRERIAEADERVAAAQRNLAEARRAQDRQQVEGARQILRAQQALVSAQRQLQTATVTAGAAGSASMTKLREAMDALSPTGQRFAVFLHGLRPAFARLKGAAEETVLPGIQAGLEAMLPVLPQVEKFIRAVGTAVGDFAKAFGEAMASPFWQDFFDRFGKMAGPMFESFGTILDGLGRAFGTLLLAFAPLAQEFADGFAAMAQDFAAFIAEWVKSDQFEAFLEYMRRNGPRIVALLLALAEVGLKLLVALAPLGEIVLTALVDFLNWLAAQDPQVILGVAAAIAAVAGGIAILVGAPGAAIAALAAAIVGLIGMIVYAYQNWEGFRNVVDTTARAIAAAAVWMWETVLKPTFQAMVDFWNNVLSPAVSWLWNRVIKPAWDGISAAISWAWNNVIQPAMEGFRFFLENILGPVVLLFWNRAIKPAWTGIQVAISIAWAAIKVVFGLIQIGVKILAGVFTWLWENVIRPVWSWIYDRAIKPAWDRIRPIFQALGNFLRETVVPAFRSGVEAIGRAWEGIQEKAKAPVRFVVDTVLNQGILKGYNTIAKAFGVKPDNVRIDLPKGFARGGILPGWSPGRDIHRFVSPTGGVLDLSGGEPILRPEAGRVLGAGWVHGINAAARSGGTAGVRKFLGGGHQHFKDGGFWEGAGDVFTRARNNASSVIGGVKDFLGDPIRTLRGLGDKLIGLIPNRAVQWVKAIAAMPQKLLSGALAKIRDVIGGEVTGEFRQWGQFGGGWPPSPAAQRGDSGVWRTIHAMVKASGIPHSFGNSYRHGDPLWHGSGRAIDYMGYNQDRLAQYFMAMRPRVLELIHTTDSGGYYITRGQRVASMGVQDELHRNHLHIAMAGGGILPALAGMPALYDQGGYLPPGISVVANATGRPEPVLTDDQWQAMMSATRGGDGPREVHHWQVRDTTLTPQFVQRWQDKRDALARVNRTNR